MAEFWTLAVGLTLGFFGGALMAGARNAILEQRLDRFTRVSHQLLHATCRSQVREARRELSRLVDEHAADRSAA